MKYCLLIQIRMLLFYVVSITAACGGGHTASAVRYQGDALVVDEVIYPWQPFETKGCIEGVVYISNVPTQVEHPYPTQTLESRLDELGLTNREPYDPYNTDPALSSYLIQVPVGWEDQWVRVLQGQQPKLNYPITVRLECLGSGA